jgi:hypothetical protein
MPGWRVTATQIGRCGDTGIVAQTGRSLAGEPCLQIDLLYSRRCLATRVIGRVFICNFNEYTAILELFSTRKLAELATSLAQDVARRYPPAIANNPVQMVSRQRLSEILDEVLVRADEFSREHRLGWYKRTRLGARFRWELNELGYDETFVATATKGLMRCVTRNPSIKS